MTTEVAKDYLETLESKAEKERVRNKRNNKRVLVCYYRKRYKVPDELLEGCDWDEKVKRCKEYRKSLKSDKRKINDEKERLISIEKAKYKEVVEREKLKLKNKIAEICQNFNNKIKK